MQRMLGRNWRTKARQQSNLELVYRRGDEVGRDQLEQSLSPYPLFVLIRLFRTAKGTWTERGAGWVWRAAPAHHRAASVRRERRGRISERLG
jgi:hypothetical protein